MSLGIQSSATQTAANQAGGTTNGAITIVQGIGGSVGIAVWVVVLIVAIVGGVAWWAYKKLK